MTPTLALHMVAVALLATNCVALLLPLLCLKYFQAGEWQTVLITAAPSTLMVGSVLWNVLLARMSVARYLTVYWVIAVLPLGMIALAGSYGELLGLYLVACAGAGGWTPVQGALLKQLYPDHSRGRAFGALSVATVISQMLTLFVAGKLLRENEQAFRILLPVSAALQAGGLLLLTRLSRPGGHVRRVEALRGVWRELSEPFIHLREVLATDRRFRRYEMAFMTYGCGFMICDALLPVFAVHRLHMTYDEVANWAHVSFRLAMLGASVPLGWLMDRIGLGALSGLSFAWLALYPLGLTLTNDRFALGAASALYGVGMAGVFLGWTLGPVSLAPTPDRVPQYMAIHQTLVGVRGVLFQGLGMLVYRATGSFSAAFLLAAAAFLWSAMQMRQLQGDARATRRERPDADIGSPPNAIGPYAGVAALDASDAAADNSAANAREGAK